MTSLLALDLLRPGALLLLPLPWIFWRWARASSSGRTLVIPERIQTYLAQFASPRRQRVASSKLRWVLATAGWAGLVLALSGPLSGKIPLPDATGRDLIIVIDLSKSMQTQDVKLGDDLVTRVAAVKTLAGRFIRRRDGDRIALVVFADQPFLIAPLTYDVATVSRFLDEVGVGLPGNKTALGDAIALSVNQLSGGGSDLSDGKVLLVLTDGVSNAGANSPERAASLAAKLGVRIHTIGFGAHIASAGAPSKDGEPSQIDKELRAIAVATGGQHFSAPSAVALQSVYRTLEAIEPTESSEATRYIRHDLTPIALSVSVVMLLLLALLDWRTGK